MNPVLLPANQFPRFYRGGAAIAELRGTGDDGQYVPEDWVGSTTNHVVGSLVTLGPAAGIAVLEWTSGRSRLSNAPNAHRGVMHDRSPGSPPLS